MAGKVGNPNIADAGKDHQWQPGQSGNPAGKEPGTRSLSTIIRDVLESETFDWDLVPDTPKDFAEKYKGKSAWEALVYVAYGQAQKGEVKAMEWLRKAGYGDKLDINPILPPGAVSILNAREIRITVVDGDTDNDPGVKLDAQPQTADSPATAN